LMVVPSRRGVVPVFILPMRISRKVERRKQAPPARPEPPSKPDLREVP